jgi:thioredoxin 1
MSKSKYESYAKFSGYNNESKNDRGPYKKYSEITGAEAPKLPTPEQLGAQGFQPPPQQQGQQLQGQQGAIRSHQDPSRQGPPQGYEQQQQAPSRIQSQPSSQPSSQGPLRVREIEGPKLYNLLTDKRFHVTKNQRPTKVAIKVYTDWCGPCKIVAPKFEEIANNPKYSDILFVKVNADTMGEELKKLFNIGAVPVFFGYIAGQRMSMIPGADILKITEMCDELASYK